MLVLLVAAAKILAVKVGTSIDPAHMPALCFFLFMPILIEVFF